MLKINLLPVRQLKKRANAKNQLLGMLLLFLLVITVLGVTGALQANKISNLGVDIKALQKEKDSYTPTLQKIARLKKDREEYFRKTEIIKKLKSDSSLTVRTLDEVANRVDNQRMWLESLNQQTSSLRLSGVALDNQTIAQFMDHLKESPFVQNVTLASSSLKVVSGRNLKSFQLSCAVAQPQNTETETTDVK
ncbi:MAG: pilus assembly protein PilN [Desulforhopalus sp.]|jgi:type IV pilus assembly protein PilN|nr:pilus assembly protein PilN [Desulforhopalus sp.]